MTNCANCGDPETRITGTTYNTVINLWRFRLQWVDAQSEYCSTYCMKEYLGKNDA